jgi:hypothetical protein
MVTLVTVPQPGQPAPNLILRDHDDREAALSCFWQHQMTVFVFVRHFG